MHADDSNRAYSQSSAGFDGNEIEVIQEFWMQYVFRIEHAFRSLQGNPQKVNMLTRGLDELLADIQEEGNYFDAVDYPPMALPSTGDVRAPGKPKKASRIFSVKKDYVKKSAKIRQQKKIKQKQTRFLRDVKQLY